MDQTIQDISVIDEQAQKSLSSRQIRPRGPLLSARLTSPNANLTWSFDVVEEHMDTSSRKSQVVLSKSGMMQSHRSPVVSLQARLRHCYSHVRVLSHPFPDEARVYPDNSLSTWFIRPVTLAVKRPEQR